MDRDGSIRIGIVTGTAAPSLTDDGVALRGALEQRGYEADPVVWSDDVDWSGFDVLLVRSCWEYHEDADRFLSWLDTVERRCDVVINDPEIVRWNIHKSYLRDLADAGVAVAPTAYVDAGSDVDLADVADRHGWSDVVVKPAVGTSSVGVWRTAAPGSPDARRRFRDARRTGDLLVQQFLPQIDEGEFSFVFFAGEFSHATRSVPADGEFRAHHIYGGTAGPYDPDGSLVSQARTALSAAADVCSVDPTAFVYARVDGVATADTFRLLELELIEPYLGLTRSEGVVDRFADAITDVITDAIACETSQAVTPR